MRNFNYLVKFYLSFTLNFFLIHHYVKYDHIIPYVQYARGFSMKDNKLIYQSNFVMKWYYSTFISTNHSSYDYSKVLCNFGYNNQNSSSTFKDIISSYIYNKVGSSLILIKSARHVKCKASIILTMNQKAYDKMPSNYISTIESLNVHIHLIHKIHFNIYRDFVRQFALYDFILIHYPLYHRFIEIDSFDSFFQSDPFLYIPFDGLGFSLHPYLLGDPLYVAQTNLKWVNDIVKFLHFDPIDNNKVKTTYVICAGILYGSCSSFLKFTQAFLIPLLDVNSPVLYKGTDQGYFNFLFLNDYLQKLPFKIYFSQYDGYFSSVDTILGDQGLSLFINEEKAVLGNLTFKSSHIAPSAIHQYIRDKKLLKMVNSAC